MSAALAIRSVSIPPESLTGTSLAPIHYQDAYACTLHSARPLTVEDTVYAFFDSAPAWVERLMALRNWLMHRLGLKTGPLADRATQRRQFRVAPGQGLGPFQVKAVGPEEVLLGEDDRHLDFRVGFRLQPLPRPGAYELTLATTVQFHNAFGRLYFLPVRPVHSLLVPSLLRGIAAHLSAQAEAPEPAAAAGLAPGN